MFHPWAKRRARKEREALIAARQREAWKQLTLPAGQPAIEVRAKLQGVLRFGHEDLSAYEPPDPAIFAIEAIAYIGSDDELGGTDAFDFLVCSPVWLAAHLDDPRLRRLPSGSEVIGAGIILQRRWDFPALCAGLERLCEEAAGPTWQHTASRLGRSLVWEYDYMFDHPMPADWTPPDS